MKIDENERNFFFPTFIYKEVEFSYSVVIITIIVLLFFFKRYNTQMLINKSISSFFF